MLRNFTMTTKKWLAVAMILFCVGLGAGWMIPRKPRIPDDVMWYTRKGPDGKIENCVTHPKYFIGFHWDDE